MDYQGMLSERELFLNSLNKRGLKVCWSLKEASRQIGNASTGKPPARALCSDRLQGLKKAK